MREIKFRGWYGEKIGMQEPEFNGRINGIFADRTGVYMQYTGLKDKNGVEIYEGDIVQEAGVISVVSFCVDGSIGSCGCCYDSFQGSGFKANNIDLLDCVVLGNSYEHPHLLEASE